MAEPVYLSGGRIQGRSDDETIPTVPQTGWKVLDSYDPQSETATAFTAKDNIIVLAWGKRAGSGSNGVQMRFNGETSSDNTLDTNYETNNSGTYNASGNTDKIDLFGTTVEEAFAVVEIRNEANRDKLIHYQANGGSGTGNNVPQFVDGVARYQPATASERITEVNITPQSSFQAGSKVVVLGCNDDEADSGTDFFTVLKDVDNVTDSTSSGTFTAKDFLRIQISTQGDGTSANAIVLGDTANSNTEHVGQAWADNTTSAYTANGSPSIFVGNMDNTNQNYITMWIANISGREKPFIARITENKTLGTDIQTSILVGKFKTTSGQITQLRMAEHTGGTYTGNSRITVWGGSA